MTKEEGRKILRQLQKITNFKGDEQAQDVIDELRLVLPSLPQRELVTEQEEGESPQRKVRGGRNREERGGRNRSEE